MPTVGQCPPGKNRPRSARYGASSAPPCTAGEALTMPVASSYAISLERAEVDDQRVGADRPLRPAVAAGADRHLPAALAGQPDAEHDVVLGGRPEHGGRLPGR